MTVARLINSGDTPRAVSAGHKRDADNGFIDIAVDPQADSAAFIEEWDPDRDLSEYVVSAIIEARKPA